MKKTLKTLVTVCSIAISIAIIVLAALQLVGRWDGAVNLLIPLMGLNLLCQALTQWESSRKVAYFSLGAAIFVLICSIVVFFVP